MDIETDETLMLPCRHCASIGLEVKLALGRHARRCAKCGNWTEIAVARGASSRWAVTSRTIDGPPRTTDL